MDQRALREQVCQANRDLARTGLVVLAFGNISAIDRAVGVVAIKPSGAAYEELRPDDIALVELASGAPWPGAAGGRPSSDTPTHLELYRHFEGIGGVVHTHSPYATSWAQAGRAIPCLGTTHADHFRGPVPVTRPLEAGEIAEGYEANTGRAIVERFARDGLDPGDLPACLVAGHGPFAWGASPSEALDNAIALEHVAAIATHQATLGELRELDPALLERHFTRKHGPGAYYGQPAAATTHR